MAINPNRHEKPIFVGITRKEPESRKIKRVRVGMLEIREWYDARKEWIIGVNSDIFQEMLLEEGCNRYDIRQILQLSDEEYSQIALVYGARLYPWFGHRPLATFPDYWTAKKFAVEWIEPQILINKMAGIL